MAMQYFGRTAVGGNRPMDGANPILDSQQTKGLRNAGVFVVVGRRTSEGALPIPQFRDVPTDAYQNMTEIPEAYSMASAGSGDAYEFRVYYKHIPIVKHGYNGMAGEYIGQLNFPGASGGAYSWAIYRNLHPDIYRRVYSSIVHEVMADPGKLITGPKDYPALTVAAWTFDFSDNYFANFGVRYEPDGFVDQGQSGVYNSNVGGDGILGYRFGILNVLNQDGGNGWAKHTDFYLRSPTTPAFGGGYKYSLTLRRIELIHLPDLLLIESPTVATVIQQICARANLPTDKIDVSRLPYDTVGGLAITNSYPSSEGLRALARVYFFDDSSFDGKINFLPRGLNSVATITEDDMVDESSEMEQLRKSDAISIPRVLNLNYYDQENGGLSTAKQTSTRSGDRRANGDMSLETPVVMGPDRAARTVDVTHKVMIEQAKGEMKFSLPDSYLRLVNANAIIVQWRGRSERAIIVKTNLQDGYQEYTLLRDRQSAYVSTVEGIPPPRPTAPPSSVPGPTLIQALDIPILRDADDNAGLGYYMAVGGMTDAWAGALVELSYDGGENYVDSRDASISAIIGQLVNELPEHPQEFPDTTNTVIVRIDTFDAVLSSTDLAGMLNRANLAVIGDELVNFGNANDLGDGTWELSYFLRGRKGTAPATHAPETRFVLLDLNSLVFVPASIADIGRTLTFRATSRGTTPDTGTVVSMTYTGQCQTERAPGYLTAVRDGTDLIVEWQGVGRLGGGGSVAHGSRFTGYRLTLSDGVNPDIIVDTTAQNSTQDVSSLTTSPITVSVVQLNSLTGEGPAAEVVVE